MRHGINGWLPAIETRWGGHLFRSRLEARWAAFFDGVGIRWTYEPFDAAGYIPDFLCRYMDQDEAFPFIVEAKGMCCNDTRLADELRRTRDLLPHSDVHICFFCIVGCDPDFRSTKPVVVEQPNGTPDRWDCPIGRIGFFTSGGEVEVLHAYHLGLAKDAIPLQRAWGEAHEVSRWIPVREP